MSEGERRISCSFIVRFADSETMIVTTMQAPSTLFLLLAAIGLVIAKVEPPPQLSIQK